VSATLNGPDEVYWVLDTVLVPALVRVKARLKGRISTSRI